MRQPLSQGSDGEWAVLPQKTLDFVYELCIY